MGSFQKGDSIQTDATKRFKFPLPELGKDKYILIRAMSAREVMDRNAEEKKVRDSFADGGLSKDELDLKVSEHPSMSLCAIIAICAIEEDGSPIFADGADVEENLKVEFPSFIGMAKKIFELSGLTNIKDRTKN